jgi:hypothetical protein
MPECLVALAVTLVPMTQEWLLVETLGTQPAVVAQGRQMKNFVPLAVFLRRNPNLSAIQTAVAATLDGGKSLAVTVSKSDRVIRTEPVAMSDGRIHAVHVWCGPLHEDPPDRPVPGPLVWDLTAAVGTATAQYFVNAGMNPETESMTGRALADDVPSRSLNSDEAKALSLTIDSAPDRTYSATWGFTDKQGLFRRVGWCVRTAFEAGEDGTQHLIARALNVLEAVGDPPLPPTNLANRILHGMSQPGVYRAIVNLSDWTPLKWLDDPCPLFDWRGRVRLHPDDEEALSARIRAELQSGGTNSTVVRLPGEDGGWVRLHVTINRVELDAGIYGGLVALRLPTDAELAMH